MSLTPNPGNQMDKSNKVVDLEGKVDPGWVKEIIKFLYRPLSPKSPLTKLECGKWFWFTTGTGRFLARIRPKSTPRGLKRHKRPFLAKPWMSRGIIWELFQSCRVVWTPPQVHRNAPLLANNVFPKKPRGSGGVSFPSFPPGCSKTVKRRALLCHKNEINPHHPLMDLPNTLFYMQVKSKSVSN